MHWDVHLLPQSCTSRLDPLLLPTDVPTQVPVMIDPPSPVETGLVWLPHRGDDGLTAHLRERPGGLRVNKCRAALNMKEGKENTRYLSAAAGWTGMRLTLRALKAQH